MFEIHPTEITICIHKTKFFKRQDFLPQRNTCLASNFKKPNFRRLGKLLHMFQKLKCSNRVSAANAIYEYWLLRNVDKKGRKEDVYQSHAFN